MCNLHATDISLWWDIYFLFGEPKILILEWLAYTHSVPTDQSACGGGGGGGDEYKFIAKTDIAKQ